MHTHLRCQNTWKSLASLTFFNQIILFGYKYVDKKLPHKSDDFDLWLKAPFIIAILYTAVSQAWAEYLYSDDIMSPMASQITGISIVY